MLLWLQKSTFKTRHSKQAVECAVHIEQRCNPFKPNVEQNVLTATHTRAQIFFEKVLNQVHCWRLPRNTFKNAAFVRCGNTCIENRLLNSPVSFHTEGLWHGQEDLIRRNGCESLSVENLVKGLSSKKIFFKNRDSSTQLDRATKPRCLICAFFELKKDMAKPTACSGISCLCHGVAQHLGTGTLHKDKCSAIRIDVS